MNIDKVNIHVLTKLCEYLLDGEPVFIIRAQDAAAVFSVDRYIEESDKEGGINLGRAREHRERIDKWQKANPTRVKPAD